MARPGTPPAGQAGLRRLGSRRADLEPLPMVGPKGVDPDLWAYAIVADRGRGWLRLTIGDVLRAHPRIAISACGTVGTAGLALLGRAFGLG